MFAFDIEGLVESIGESVEHQFADGVRESRELVVREGTVREDGKYPPALLCVTFWGERVTELDNLLPNDSVRVRVSGKSVRKEGKDKETGKPFKYWQTRLSGLECTALYAGGAAGGSTGGRTRAAPQAQPAVRDVPREVPDDDEDIPF